MIRKRSKFWTVALALIPGAGHMYNGFMKLGVSFMGIFAAVWCVASWLNFGPLMLLAPVVWFYAFFDCLNRRFQEDEEFFAQEDRYLITQEMLRNLRIGTGERTRQVIGMVLIVVGAYAIWNNVVIYWLIDAFPYALGGLMLRISHLIPQVLVAGLIIWAGVSMIRGKKEELSKEEAEG